MSPEHLPGKPQIGLLTEGAEELMMLRNGLWSQRALNLNEQALDQPVDRPPIYESFIQHDPP